MLYGWSTNLITCSLQLDWCYRLGDFPLPPFLPASLFPLPLSSYRLEVHKTIILQSRPYSPESLPSPPVSDCWETYGNVFYQNPRVHSLFEFQGFTIAVLVFRSTSVNNCCFESRRLYLWILSLRLITLVILSLKLRTSKI